MQTPILSLRSNILPVLVTAFIISGCSNSDDNGNATGSVGSTTPDNSIDEMFSIEEIFTAGSPWATTGVFLLVDDIPDRSINFIADESISAGTISSAQYRDSMFAFIGMTDFTIGSFDEAALIQSLDDVVNNGADPSGYSFGDYEIIRDGERNSIRRLSNATFAPTAVIDRTVTVANEEEFGYIFTAQDGLTYFVAHEPYGDAFPDATYPPELQAGVDALFDSRFTENRRIDQVFRESTPWATTAIFQEVNGEMDTTTNFITDPVISAGTISSAQYRDGMFMFVGMSDFTTGEFDLPPLLAALDSGEPAGFSFGDFEILEDEQGNSVRRLTNASFAPTATIDRTLTTVTPDLFTYSFELEGTTYFVEHQRYAQAFPNATFPEELQNSIDRFFSGL